MRFTNFAGGCFGKAVGFLLCIILGVVLTFGGIALTGYILLTREGMVGTMEDYAQERDLPIDFGDEYREMTLLEWGKGIIPIFGNITTTPIREIEAALGINLIAAKISEVTGLDIEVVKDSTLGEFGKTFSENLTLEQASTNFGITFPDLPAFQDEEFLSQPLSSAFAEIENFELQDFVEVTPDSSPILLSLADMKIGEMSDAEKGLDKRVNDLMLKEVITIVEEGENKSNAVLIKLKDTKVGELGSPDTNDLIMDMNLSEIIDIVEEGENKSNAVLIRLKDTKIGDLGSPETDEEIKNMPLADLLDIDDDSSPILKYFRDNQTTLAGQDNEGNPNGVNAALKVMRLGDMMTLTDPSLPGGSTKLFWALRNCPIETIPATETEDAIPGIEDTMKTLPLTDLLETGNTHIWGYLGQSTIENLGQRIDDMTMSDVIDITEESPAILRKMRAFDPEKDTEGNEALFGSKDMKVSDLNTELEPLVQGMLLGEIIPIDETSEPILQALKDTAISDLNTKLSQLKINEVFAESDYSTGFLSLVDSNTPLSGIAGALSQAVSISRMQVLINCGIAAEPTIADDELDAGFRNRTINGIINDYSNLVNDPVNAQAALFSDRHYLDADQNYIDMAFLEGFADFDEGETLVLGADTTIAAEDFTVIFNIMTNGYTLTITEGATIRSSEEGADNGGCMLISNDYYIQSLPRLLPTVNGGGVVVGSFDDPEGIRDNYKINIISI